MRPLPDRRRVEVRVSQREIRIDVISDPDDLELATVDQNVRGSVAPVPGHPCASGICDHHRSDRAGERTMDVPPVGAR